MSKGLGKIERGVLDSLYHHHSKESVWSIARDILSRAKNPKFEYGMDHDWDLKPSRALEVSVRRGIKSLSKKGLVRWSYMLGEGQKNLYCWLPENKEELHLSRHREKQSVVRGSEVQEYILNAIKDGRGFNYREISRKVSSLFYNTRHCTESAANKAVKRAMRKLRKQGLL